MAYGAVGGRRVRPMLVSLLALLCLVTGCTYGDREPGLFPDPTQTPTATPSSSRLADAKVPVVGDAVWTSGDGLDITVRWAVHAVRRMPGATILDWSVTPLSGPQLQVGDPLPPQVDLGLTRNGQGYDNVSLLDLPGGRVYRPLTRRGSTTQACLCTRTTSVRGELRIGRTTVLQTAYPELPAALSTVDVDISTVPLFSRVPVSPVDQLPQVTEPVDLTRPVAQPPAVAVTEEFAYSPGALRAVITIDAVQVSDTFTSVAWSIRPATRGRGIEALPQPSSTNLRLPDRVAETLSVRSVRRWQRVRIATETHSTPKSLGCLCTELPRTTVLPYVSGQKVSVVTNLPPLEDGATRYDIKLAGVEILEDVGVPTVPSPRPLSASTRYRPTAWEMPLAMPHPGWATSDWPTPLPKQSGLRDFTTTVDRIFR